ncbi:MAG: dihydropteroate synthase [Proteobacteria bacterium]|nr:dihydropteroate synthase [Pseudomonadota bacterium]
MVTDSPSTINKVNPSFLKKLRSYNQSLIFGKKTLVMGILNITPDSFTGDGLLNSQELTQKAVERAKLWLDAGVDIIDVGGESTRPGATSISLEEELERVLPVIEALRSETELPLSIDTTKSKVAHEALLKGASIINDVSGFTSDPLMIEIAAVYQVPVILVHSPQNHKKVEHTELGSRYLEDSHPSNILKECLDDLQKQINYTFKKGLCPCQIIIDPGIGFGKTVEQTLLLMRNLEKFKELGFPMLIGVSRKAFIGYTTNATVDKRLPGTIAANTIGILKGADIIRVHDVIEAIQATKIVDAIRGVI